MTVQKMHEAIIAFANMQNIEIKEGEDKFSVRLILPSNAINALMSDFNDYPNQPTWKLDEDQQFYAKCKDKNISLIIQEGKFHRIENVIPNQQIEKEMAGGDEVLPGRDPFIDHKKPLI